VVHDFVNGSVTMSAICLGLVLAGVVVENKESLNNPSNNPNKSGEVTLSEIFLRMLTRFYKNNRGISLQLHRRRSETISASFFSLNPPPGYVGEKKGFLTSVICIFPVGLHCSVVSFIWLYIEQYFQLFREAGDYSQTLNPNLNLQSNINLAISLILFGGRLR